MLGCLFRTVFTLFFVAALIAGFVAYKAYDAFTRPIPFDKPIIFEIKKGNSLNATASELARMEMLDTPYAFHFGLYAMNMDAPIKAGEYQLTPGMSARDILELFQIGPNYHRMVTVREGLTSYEIIQLLNEQEELSGKIEIIPQEGTLLPETYSHSKDEPRSMILLRMQESMTQTLDQAWENRVTGLPLDTKEEALVLASIVEKETAVSEERRRVAGVFINRLRKGMPLQTDPTVIYALTKGEHKNEGQGPLGRRLLTKDLSYDSPYNTYLYAGLPPGPIANPGKASIEATLNPEEHDYIYFVADGTGGHAFAKTLAEHNANVAKWRKIRRQNTQK